MFRKLMQFKKGFHCVIKLYPVNCISFIKKREQMNASNNNNLF